MNKSFRFPKVTRSALVMVCAVSLIGCNRNASVKTDGSRDATKVADDNVPNNKRSLTGTWVSKDRQYELIVRDDGSASFGYRGGVMNSLSWKVSSTEGIILDYGDRFPQAQGEILTWLLEGKLKHDEHIVEGLEHAPEALNLLFTGGNTGKVVVKL